MSLNAHLEELRRKHENMKVKVKKAQHTPGYDSFQVLELKKQKLRIKEEIHRLSA